MSLLLLIWSTDDNKMIFSRIFLILVWEHEAWEKHLILKEICEHVLMRHLSLPKQNIITIVDQLDFVLRLGNKGVVLPFLVIFNGFQKLEESKIIDNCNLFSDPVSHAGSLMKAYDDLSKHLRLLDDIPLRISSVQPLDSGFFS